MLRQFQLTAILNTLAALETALAPLLAHKTTAQRRQTRRQAPASALLLLLLRWRRRLLVLHGRGLLVVHLLLLLLGWVALRGSVAVWEGKLAGVMKSRCVGRKGGSMKEG